MILIDDISSRLNGNGVFEPHVTHLNLTQPSIFGSHVHLVMIHTHLLVWATSERFLPAGSLLRVGLASESHWLQPVSVLTVHRWPTPASVGGP